jgi:outer membrane protein TolC
MTEAAGFPEPDTPGPWAESLRQVDAQSSLAAENARLRAELALLRSELEDAEDALTTAEAELEQAIKLYPTPDEVVVLREDLQAVLTVVSLHTPVEFRPAAIVGRLAAAAGVG